MSNIAFLSHIGCFVVEKFLTNEYCEQLRAEALMSGPVAARLVNDRGAIRVDDVYRKTKTARISKSTLSALHKQLLLIKPKIEEHFNTELVDCEEPHVLIYREGDFFKAHKDAGDEDNAKVHTTNRKVSIVIFLNNQSTQPYKGDYCGGSLNLYGLIAQPGWEDKGFSVGGQPGLLIAFTSRTIHEVTSVTHGERFTIVSWFY